MGTERGITVWRIEKFEASHWPVERALPVAPPLFLLISFYFSFVLFFRYSLRSLPLLCSIPLLSLPLTPRVVHGKFHTGDSYIVLHTIHPYGPYHIFYWLGAESTQDETGAAALKAVQLNDTCAAFSVILITSFPVNLRGIMNLFWLMFCTGSVAWQPSTESFNTTKAQCSTRSSNASV